MHHHPPSLLLLLLLAGGCGGGGTGRTPHTADTDTPAPGPRWWEALSPAAPAPFLPLLQVSLPEAQAPSHLQALPARGLVFVTDPDADTLWVLDSRYRHDPEGHCVSTAEWPELADADQRQGCPEGSVRIQRGALSTPGSLQAAAVDTVGLAALTLDTEGRLWWYDADILRGNPLDHLRPLQQLLPTEVALSGAASPRLAAAGDRLAVANGTDLWWLDRGTSPATLLAHETLPADALDLALLDGVAWVRTEAGLLRDGVLLDDTAGAADLDLVAGRAALTLPDQDAVVVLDPTSGAEVQRLSVARLRGPLAQDPLSGHIFVVTDAGLTEVATGATLAGDFVDVTVGAAHEVVALSAAGTVEVYGDDAALAEVTADLPPVALMAAAFVERPRAPENDVPCRGAGDETVQAFAAHVVQNAVLLEDLPAGVALGVTPHFARRALACEEYAALDALAGLSRASAGVLFHQVSTCDADDLACEADFLRAEADALADAGLDWTFSSGLSSRTGDWTAALHSISGQPGKYLFFGMSILPDLGHDGDPRAKDAWPLTERASAWWVAHTEAVAVRDAAPADAVAFYPGDNIPAFNLGSCANLLLRECHLLGEGEGSNLRAEDGAVLLLLTRRAVAERTAAASAWSFHLPDLGVYDYTDGASCSRSADGAWTGGEDCEAVTLQAWAAAVHTRYVLPGLARWAAPSALEEP